MSDPQSIPYAQPRPRETERHSSVAGGVAMLFMSLGLILLGGCFLIGVVLMYSKGTFDQYPSTEYWPPALKMLPWLLYLLAFSCFAAALWMMLAGVRWIYAAAR
jgi:hypothetical protein